VAGVARDPACNRYFAFKEELTYALGQREYRRFNTAMSAALSGRFGVARLEVADRPGGGVPAGATRRAIWSTEPGFVKSRCTSLADGLGGPEAVLDRDMAGRSRTALSHYIFPELDPTAAAVRIRAAAGFDAGVGDARSRPDTARPSGPTADCAGTGFGYSTQPGVMS